MRLFVITYLACTLNCIAQNVISLKGKSPFVNSGKIYLYKVNQPEAVVVLVDSAFIIDGSFHLETIIEEPSHFYLVSDKLMGKFPFIWDNNVIITLGGLNMANSAIEHSPASDDWELFNSQLNQDLEQAFITHKERLKIYKERSNQKDTTNLSTLYKEEATFFLYRSNQVKRFITLHPTSWTSLFLLCWYRQELGRSLTSRQSKRLSQQLQKSKLYLKLDLALQNM